MARSLIVISLLFQSTTHCRYRVYTKFLLTYTAIYRRNRKVLPLGITALKPQSHFHLGITSRCARQVAHNFMQSGVYPTFVLFTNAFVLHDEKRQIHRMALKSLETGGNMLNIEGKLFLHHPLYWLIITEIFCLQQ
jgi:hypothetical protein